MSALLSHRLSFVVVLEKIAVILAGRCTLVLVCLCPSSAFALSVLTLGDAIALVKEQNLELKEMSYRVDLSETAVDLARAAFYPNLEITINPTQLKRLQALFVKNAVSEVDLDIVVVLKGVLSFA